MFVTTEEAARNSTSLTRIGGSSYADALGHVREESVILCIPALRLLRRQRRDVPANDIRQPVGFDEQSLRQAGHAQAISELIGVRGVSNGSRPI